MKPEEPIIKPDSLTPNNPEELSRLMKGVIDNSLAYEQATKVEVEKPFVENWEALFKILLKDNNG